MAVITNNYTREHPAQVSDFEYSDKQQKRVQELAEEIDFIRRLSPREYHFFTLGHLKREEKRPLVDKVVQNTLKCSKYSSKSHFIALNVA